MDLDKKTEKDLNKMLEEKRVSLRNLRFGSSGSKSKNVKESGVIRKEIAKILTELRLREVK